MLKLISIVNAESRARRLNAGAQKRVIHLVKNMESVVCTGSAGSKYPAEK